MSKIIGKNIIVSGTDSSINVNSGGAVNVLTDGVTLNSNGSNQLEVATGGVSRTQLAAVGQQISSSSGDFYTTSISPVSVTNLSVTITTTGRPVFVFLQSDASGSNSYLQAEGGTTSVQCLSFISIQRNGTTILESQFGNEDNPTSSGISLSLPPGCISILDVGAAAGSNTYVVKAWVNSSPFNTGVYNIVLVAYEL